MSAANDSTDRRIVTAPDAEAPRSRENVGPGDNAPEKGSPRDRKDRKTPAREKPSPRPLAWDGLGLTVPADWEPSRLGLGFMLLENAAGPRLTLRWQRGAGRADPRRLLKKLARRKLLTAEERPTGVLAAMLKALPEGARAVPCRDPAGTGPEALVFTLPEDDLAVLAAAHAAPDEPSADWTGAMRGLKAESPGLACLYDIRLQAPEGFALKAFTLLLGHYRLLYAKGGDSLEYHRFAPSEVLLRGKTLEDWAAGVFSQALGRKHDFSQAYLDSFPAAVHRRPALSGPAESLRRLAARLASGARLRRAAAWRPDASRILAVLAETRLPLDDEAFREICRRHALFSNQT